MRQKIQGTRQYISLNWQILELEWHELIMNTPAAFHDRARLLQSIHVARDYYFREWNKHAFEFLCKARHLNGIENISLDWNLSEKDELTDKKKDSKYLRDNCYSWNTCALI